MSASRLQPPKSFDHFAPAENLPLAIGANFHDDPMCRSTARKSHTLGLDAQLPPNYAPHTHYNYTGKSDDFSWLYQKSSTTYGESAARALGASDASSAAAASAAENESPVLRFLAYIRELILESSVERTRIRKVGIVIHTQDNTIAIREARQPNSGIVQGQILQRQRVPRDLHGDMQDVLTADDFVVGGSVTIYGVTYHIVDCDERTRAYLKSKGRAIPDLALPWPVDQDTYNAKVQEGLHHKAKKLIPTPIMDQKRVVEQLLSGIISKHPPDEVHMAQQFLRNKIHEHLQFAAYWDDRESISGDLRLCAIRYFLENDTVEIIEVRPENAGREGSCKLLGRQRVAKDGSELPVHVGPQNTFGVILKENYLEPTDIHIGEALRVHKRQYFVYDADEFTRAYMQKHYQIVLPPAVDVSGVIQRGQVAPPVQHPPSHDGFGSDEDSLQNWKYLTLKPPKVDLHKQEHEAGKVMVFSCTFAPPVSPEDAGRKFVLCFYRATDEVEIIETAVKNSGIVGGKFLVKRRHLKTLPDGRQVPYTADDFVVGKPVTILKRTFQLHEIDRRSERQVQGIPDPITEDRVRELIITFKVLLHSKFLRIHEAYRQLAPSGALTVQEIRDFFRASSFLISEDEAIYMVQHLAPLGGGVIGFDDFIRLMDVPNSDNVDESSLHPRSVKGINMSLDASLAHATRSAAEGALKRSLTRQLLDKISQRRGTVQEVFRLMAGHRANGKLNRSEFSAALKDQLHFNLVAREHQLLVDIVFTGAEDANGDITVKQFHEFIERYA